ncbi:MAG: hypothetical protein H7296_12290 [Bacteroidia bacterium]|nr:hypothetical protein [Bacteroidia bacterium]
MKNLFNSEHRKELIKKIDSLKPDLKPIWGRMHINQNLRHMSLAFQIPLGTLNPTIGKLSPLPKWLFKLLLLNRSLPKEKAETFKEMNMIENMVNPKIFEAEKNNLKAMIETFVIAKALIPINKVAGKFSKADWGKLNWNHTNHHLRQFGV